MYGVPQHDCGSYEHEEDLVPLRRERLSKKSRAIIREFERDTDEDRQEACYRQWRRR